MIFSDKTQVVTGQNNSVSLWRKTSEKRKPFCLNQRKSPLKVRWIFLGCITCTYDGIDVTVPVNGNLSSLKYIYYSIFIYGLLLPNFSEIVNYFIRWKCHPCFRQRNTWKHAKGIQKFNWLAPSLDLNIIVANWQKC